MIKLIENTKPFKNLTQLQTQYNEFLKSSPVFVVNIKNISWISKIKDRCEQVSRFKKIAVLGIGGSSLGLKAIFQALKPSKEILFFESLDSVSILEKLKKIDFQDTHFVVVSKSGNTIETMEQLNWLNKNYFLKNNFLFSKQMTIITEDKKNPLYDFAIENFVPRLDIPLELGGRYSVLSPVGLYASELSGLSSEKFIEGANWALDNNQLIVELTDQLLQSLKDDRWITNLWIYSERLTFLGAWFEQLWAESLAKNTTRSGELAPRISTPNTMIGSQDQHSLLQQAVEGAKDKFFIFVRSNEEEVLIPELGKILKAQALSVQRALKEVNADSVQLFFDEVNEKQLGAYFMMWQLTVSFIGHLYGINAFDQPGVERAKVLTKEILKRS